MSLFRKYYKNKNCSSHSKKNDGDKTALGWLRDDEQKAGLLQTASYYLSIQNTILDNLHDPVTQACKILKFDNGTLVIAVPSAAYAAKIRQLTPRISQLLMKQGLNVHEVRIRIQANLQKPEKTVEADNKNKAILNQSALNAFDKLQKTLPEGELSDAIARILKRRKNLKPNASHD